jgi:hypothetical protein
MSTTRLVLLPPEAAMALNEIIGIMTDQLLEGNMTARWDAEKLVELQMKLHDAQDGEAIEIDISEAALLLDGMAFTEVMSVEFPFFEMVQWTSDFVTGELRGYWTEDEWRAFAAR